MATKQARHIFVQMKNLFFQPGCFSSPVYGYAAARQFSTTRKRGKCCHTKSVKCAYNTTVVNEQAHEDIKPFRDIPGSRGLNRVPILGTILAFYPFTNNKKSHLHKYFHGLHKKYGKMARFTLGVNEGVILFDPILIDTAIRHEGQYPLRIGLPILQTYAKRNDYQSFSIRQGEDWYVHRKALQVGMSKSAVVKSLDTTINIADDIVQELEKHANKPCTNTKRIFMAYAAETAADMIFSKRLHLVGGEPTDNEESNLFLDSINDMFSVISESFYTIPTFLLFRTPVYNRFEAAMNNVIKFCKDRINEAKEELENNPENIKDNLMKKLYQTENVDKAAIDSILAGSLFGGIEMISQNLTWFLWTIGMNPDKQERLVKEIIETCGVDGSPTQTNLGHMPYLKACVKENMRLIFPTANGSMRVMPEEIILSGYRIPKGAYVFFGHNTICRSSEYFENPDQFIPERWLHGVCSPNTKRLMSLCALPFGHGARNCVGRRVAEQQMFVAIIKILQKYEVVVPENSRCVDIYYTVTAMSKSPVHLQFNARYK